MAKNQQYFGKVQKINDQYVRLCPVYYRDSAKTLQLVGDELSAPEPAMYVRAAEITSVSRLTPISAQLQAIKSFERSRTVPAVQDATPSIAIDEYIKPSQYQAVMFADGNEFYGRLASVTSGQVFADNSSIFTLKSSGMEVSLVKVQPTELANRTSSQVVFWENLVATGQVSKAINLYMKQNP